MLETKLPTRIDLVVARLEAWLETMRCPEGYGGPVAHWWQQSLVYTGPGLDWRYEGIIAGYLNLWERTGEKCWLEKACRAGDDLVKGQLDSGHFPSSSFEINPASAGTPHEAACDVGLLLLAIALRKAGHSDWEQYRDCAQYNLQEFYIGKLWDSETQFFRDNPNILSFVPNKVATASDAFFLLYDITGESDWVEKYVLPNLNQILNHQVKAFSDKLDGAVAQNTLGTKKIETYFPKYNARCVPALVRGFHWTNKEEYLDAALRIMLFIYRWAYADGQLPTAIYQNNRVNRYPSWIAPLADVLRAADLLRPYGLSIDFDTTLHRILDGQDESGGIQTATGFAAQAGGKVPHLPDFRDVLHVTGWCDKAFRYLSLHISGKPLPSISNEIFETTCIFQGKTFRLLETPEVLAASDLTGKKTNYYWVKGHSWAETSMSEFWLK